VPAGGKNRPNVEENRGSDAGKSLQSWIIARNTSCKALTKEQSELEKALLKIVL